MEKISGELKRAELKKETLFKAYEQVHSQASSFLLFSLQWKDLEECFDGIRRSLECRAEELREGERSLAERARDVASREDQLRSACQKVEECEEEVRRKKMELRSVEMRLEECGDEHRKKESELVQKRDALGECNSLIRDKEKELCSLMQATEECRREFDTKKEEVEVLRRELDLKEKIVVSLQSLLEKNARELDVKAEKLGSVEISLDECSSAVEIKREELSVVQSRLDHILEAREESEKRLRVMEHTIKECSRELEFKTKQLGEESEKRLRVMEHTIKECSQELEFKTKQLDSIRRRSRECFTDLELTEKHLYMLNVSIGERSRIFEMQKQELDVQCTQLEMGRQRLDSIEKSIEKHSREMELRERTSSHSGVMVQNSKHPYGPVVASCLNSQPTFAFNGKDMQMFVYRHFQELNGVCHKVLEIIQTSTKAAKWVLGAMEGFYPQDSGNGDGLLDIGVIRRSCIFLLENFIRSSVEIKPQQREAAMKLAVEWKGKLKFSPSPEDPLEVLGFLKLLEAYKLASAFNADEIHDLVNSVSQFQIAQELYQVLGSSALPPVKRRCSY